MTTRSASPSRENSHRAGRGGGGDLGGRHRPVRRARSGRDVDPRHRRPVEGQPRAGVSALRHQGPSWSAPCSITWARTLTGLLRASGARRCRRAGHRPADCGSSPARCSTDIRWGQLQTQFPGMCRAARRSAARATHETAARGWPSPMPLALQFGWRLFEPFLRASTGLDELTDDGIAARPWAPRWPGSSNPTDETVR